MKARVIRAFKDASVGARYEVGQEIEYNEKHEKLGYVEKIPEPEKKVAPKKKDKE